MSIPSCLCGDYRFYINGDPSPTPLGLLYNWFAATDARNIANTGWHVPTVANWETLKTYIGGFAEGHELKETGTIYWNAPNTGATNSLGFNGRGAGVRDNSGIFNNLLTMTVFATADAILSNYILTYNNGIIGMNNAATSGFSIRLLADSTMLSDGETGTYIGNNGRIYNTICIGGQEWLSVNLAETEYRNGDAIPNVTNDAAWAALTTGAYCVYNNAALPDVVHEVFPTNFLETALVDELERDQIFYRRKFSGSLVFGGQLLKDDFDYFWAIEQVTPCTRLDFTIYKDSVLYWEGYFATSNGSWDLDACTFTVTPLPEDDYVELLDEGDLEYNILTSGVSEVTTTYDNGVTTIAYTHNRLFYDVIEYLADLIIPGITLSSTFFEDATNPVTLLTNHYDYLTIAQKSDIKYPTATNSATVGMMSFNQAMQICRSMNLYWDYDGTTLRIEHVSFWPETDGLNIRTQKLTQGTNKYKYINEQLPKYETFKWMEAEATDFIGAPIWYNSSCVNQDVDSNTSEFALNVTTDLEFIQDCMADPEDKESLISNDGWVLLANRLVGPDLYVYFGTGEMGGTHFNIDLAWSRLHAAFWKHNRQLIEGYMNNNLTDFYTSKKIRQQECSIISCDPFDPTELITTELGDDYFGGVKGGVKTATIKPYGQIDLVLQYGYTANENTGLTADKTLIIAEEKTGATETTYTVTLCEAEVVDLTISIWLTCIDSTLATCDTAPVDVVITAGNVQGVSAPITWCDPGAGADCIVIRHKSIAPLLGWVGDFINDPDANC